MERFLGEIKNKAKSVQGLIGKGGATRRETFYRGGLVSGLNFKTRVYLFKHKLVKFILKFNSGNEIMAEASPLRKQMS